MNTLVNTIVYTFNFFKDYIYNKFYTIYDNNKKIKQINDHELYKKSIMIHNKEIMTIDEFIFNSDIEHIIIITKKYIDKPCTYIYSIEGNICDLITPQGECDIIVNINNNKLEFSHNDPINYNFDIVIY